MAKKLSKKTTEYLRTDLMENVHDLAELFSVERAHDFAESASFLLRLVGRPIVAYHDAKLTDEQQVVYDRLVSERETARRDHETGKATDQIKLDHNLILKDRFDKADPADYGAISVEVEQAKTEALLSYVADYESKLADLSAQIKPLADIKVLAALAEFDSLTEYSGSASRSNAGTRPDLPGNAWLVLDLYTRSDEFKNTRCQFYLDPECTLYVMPVGSDWFKSVGAPFALPEGWTKLGIVPADKLTSATILQAFAVDLLRYVKQKDSAEAWFSSTLNTLAMGNLSTTDVGGSRNVWQVVAEKQDPGYVRQVYGSKLDPYALPTPDPTPDPAPDPKVKGKTAKK